MHPKQVEWVKNKMIDPIVKSVNDKFLDRSARGQIKYNTNLFENNSDNYLQHLQEELMDGSLYIQKLLQQQKDIKQLCNKYPNDQQLGIEIRKIYGSN